MWRWFLVIVSVILHVHVWTQNAPIKIEISSSNFSLFHWTTENGLPQNNVQNICEDQSGLLWISTFDGLSRFDGNSFTNYDEGNVRGLSSSTFLEMFNDKAKNVWFTTNEQIGRISNGKIKSTFNVTEQRPELLKRGANLFAKYNSTLFLIDSSKYKIQTKANLNEFTIVCNESPILLTKEHGLYSFSESMQLQYIGDYEGVTHLGSNVISAKNAQGEFNLFQCYSNEIVPYRFTPSPARFNEKNAVSIHQSGNYTIIENKDSLFIYSQNENLLAESKDALNIQKIKCTFINEQGQIYIGTNGQGLFLFNPKKLKSFEGNDFTQSVNGHLVYYSKDNRIYMDGGCQRILEINPDLEILSEREVNGCPWTILFDYQSNLWVNGILEDTLKSSYQHREMKNLIQNKTIYSVFEFDETIYVGTDEGVFYCTNKKAGRLENTEQLKAIYMFYVNQNEELLFCSDKGIGLVQDYTVQYVFQGDEDGYFNDIRSVYQDSDGNYWIGSSKNGLGVVINNQLYRFPYSDGRLNKNVWCIIEDDFGNLWMNSNQGIYRANRHELIRFAQGEILDFKSMHFTEADGLISSEGNSRTQNKAFKDKEGNIWFSMITGPAVIDPSSIVEENEDPIILDYIEVDGININPNNPNIQPDFSQVGFAFAQNNSSNSNLSYVYKLGDENSWNIVGNKKFVSFSELGQGSYELMIKRAGSDYSLKIPFTVKAHFYQSDVFKNIIVASITAIIFFGLFLLWRNSKRIKAKKKRQDAELKSLELVALQSQMNPHFVFNCLSSISALYISGNQKSANFYMSRFSALLRIILEHAQKRLITLREDLEMFDIYVPLEGLQFDEPFDFELIVDPTLPKDNILIPSMVTHTFIENAIKHGLKPLKDRKGKLTITVDKHEDFTRVCIEDNGIGYENSIKAKKSKVMIHRSHGLKNTGKRIELINLLNDLNITVDTSNLKDENGSSIGTKVTILFPYIDQQNNENARN